MLAVLSLYCLLVSYINKYSWYFVIISWSLIGAMYASFLLISTSGNYSSIGYIFDDLDKKIFLAVIKNRIGFFKIERIFNLTSAIYLTTLTLFTMSYFYKIKKRFSVQKIPRSLFMLLFLIVYCLFYDPAVTYRIYCAVISGRISYSAVCMVDLCLHIITYFYLIAPLFYLIKKRKLLSTYYKKQQLAGIFIFVVLTNILYLLIYRMSSMRQLYFGKEPFFLISIRTYGAVFHREYAIYPLIMFAAIGMVFVILGKFHLIRQEGLISKLLLKTHFKNINTNVKVVFHSIKNVIYSYKLNVDDILEAEPVNRDIMLKKLSNEMQNYIEHITIMLNSDENYADFAPDKYYVSDIVEEAINEFKFPENITVERNYKPQLEEVYADSFYLKEAFLNIIDNAVDAIKAKGTCGKITVTISREFDLVVIIFTDTGIGIEKKEIKNIFKTFYTTKSRIQNWGVGLSYVFKILKMHKGNISIKSKIGAGTSLYVILPRI